MKLRELVARLPVTALPKPPDAGNTAKARGCEAVTALPPLPPDTDKAEALREVPPPGMLEELEERAAIIEHDGGMTRDYADLFAQAIERIRGASRTLGLDEHAIVAQFLGWGERSGPGRYTDSELGEVLAWSDDDVQRHALGLASEIARGVVP